MISEQFCDTAFESIRFNKKNMEVVLCTIQAEWISKLYVYNRSEVAVLNDILGSISKLVYYRRHWEKMPFWYKKRILGFLYRNRRLFLDNKAIQWANIESCGVFQSVGNSYWNADIRK